MSRTADILQFLRDYESRNVTFVDPDGSWPIVWNRAQGVHVWDLEGRKYLDLTGAFGVAATGHANPRVVRAGQNQLARLPHAMGDVHPHALKAQLARELSKITFERWNRNASGRQSPKRGKIAVRSSKTIFCNSGFEAVEAALKTARLATGKRGIICFEGAYHGLGYGTLNVTHRDHFRSPFRNQLAEFGHFVPFPSVTAPKQKRPDWEKSLRSRLADLLTRRSIGAVLVEPVQARGGINIPPPGFLPLLRRLCDKHSAVLIVDEIYTGFGRTGKWFAVEHSKVVPDIICLGKALTGGFPLSACVGRADIMDAAWPASAGEAIHTSTFLGNPTGCAMALAQIGEIRRLGLPNRSRTLGKKLLDELCSKLHHEQLQIEARGQGMMVGLELRNANGRPATAETFTLIKQLLKRGFILLPEGGHGNVISLTPPLTITLPQLKQTVRALRRELERLR